MLMNDEKLVLLTLQKSEQGELYGTALQDTLLQKYGRRIGLGVLYAVLGRLRGKGWITSRDGDLISGSEDLPRLYYRATACGLEMLKKSD